MSKLKIILQSRLFYVIGLILLIIYVFISTKLIHYNSVYSGNELTISGIVNNVKVKKNNIQFEINGKEKIIANYYIKEDIPNIDNIIGSKITLNGELKKPINNTIPNNFNYKKYLYNNKIYYTFNIDSFSYEKSNNIFYIIKNKIYESIRDDNKVNEYLNLLVLGNKSLIDNETYNSYLNNGVVHLFAISGMHLGVIILILNKLLKFKYKKIVIILCLWLYSFIVSFPISVVRATLFYTISSLLKLSNIYTLYLTAFLIILFNPFSIYDIGFIYSFITVYSILINTNKIKGNYFKKLFMTSLITLIYSLPITVNLNYEINVLSIINNMIFIPLVTLLIYPLSIIVYFVPLLNKLYYYLISIMEYLNMFMCDISILKVIVPRLSIIFIIIYYLFILIIKFNKKILFIIPYIFIYKIINNIDSNYYVYYLDVGQGDSSILIGPNKKEVIMIDTGGIIDYSKVVYYKSDNTIKFLKSLGISKIDLLILSHGDNDHAGETFNIIKKYKIDNIILNKNKLSDLERNIKNNSNVVKKYNSKYFKLMNYNDYLSDDENYSSIVTHININNNKFLFMGDLPKENELKYMNEYNLKSNYIKLGHHGSKTSSDYKFLCTINPELAIISSGRNNLYNHPSIDTINILKDLNIKYLNTASNGTILIKISNGSSTISTYKP